MERKVRQRTKLRILSLALFKNPMSMLTIPHSNLHICCKRTQLRIVYRLPGGRKDCRVHLQERSALLDGSYSDDYFKEYSRVDNGSLDYPRNFRTVVVYWSPPVEEGKTRQMYRFVHDEMTHKDTLNLLRATSHDWEDVCAKQREW